MEAKGEKIDPKKKCSLVLDLEAYIYVRTIHLCCMY
jgi:hypothetical protein